MIQALISDLDGTLLPRGGSISTATLKAFQKAGEKGCLRIIATGRNLYSARQILSADFPIDYLIFSSGAGVFRWHDQQLLSAHHLNPAETREIAAYLWNYNINFTIQKEIPDNHHFYYTDLYPVHPDYQKRIATYQPFGQLIERPEEIQSNATQFVMILDAKQLYLLEKIRQDLKRFSVVRSTSPIDNRAIWLEIFAPGINKGNTCQALLNHLHLRLTETAGLGNDYNDVDFLDICAEAYLVANAPQRLKPYYKSVASDRDNGFSEFVSLILD